MRNHTSSYHAPAAILWIEKNRNYKMNKINRATRNIFLLINRLTKIKKNSATSIGHFRFCDTLNAFYLFSITFIYFNWRGDHAGASHTRTQHFSVTNLTFQPLIKLKCNQPNINYTAQFTRSTVKSACRPETSIYCACEGWYFTWILELKWSTKPCLHHR